MPTIVGPTLPEPYYGEVEKCWTEIENAFGDHGVRNPYPHVTLYGLDLETDVETLESALQTVATDYDPFTVHTDGVGVFPGDHAWIPVARCEPLAALHRDVVEAISDLGNPPTPYYDPERWFPHIGLGLGFDPGTIGEVVTFLREREDFNWSFTLNNVEITRLRVGENEYERVGSVSL